MARSRVQFTAAGRLDTLLAALAAWQATSTAAAAFSSPPVLASPLLGHHLCLMKLKACMRGLQGYARFLTVGQ